MVMPTYTNERLRKQSGVFLLTSLFSFNKDNEVKRSVISKAKSKLKEEFNANRNQVNPVTDFTKYEEDSASTMQDIGTKQPELEQYIIDNFAAKFKEVIENDDIKKVLDIIQSHFTVDWYKRKPVLSKIKMSITGYYFIKCQSKDSAKQKAEQIMTLLNQIVEDFIMTANERGD